MQDFSERISTGCHPKLKKSSYDNMTEGTGFN